MERMVQIIRDLMSSDNQLIQKATAELQEACKHWEVVQVLCEILVTAHEEHVRQYSALLLKKILKKKHQWNKVPFDQQELIKQGLVNALMQEEQNSVRKAITQVVGVLSKRSETYMTQIWEFAHSFCSANDPNQSELGSSVFAVLAESAPKQFSPHIDTVCKMLNAALEAHDSAGNMATPVICNIMCGMNALVHIALAHNTAAQTLEKALPLILKSLYAFACQPEVDPFVRAFDILESIVEKNPKFLKNYVKMLTEFCLEVSGNRQLDNAVRVKAIDYVGSLVEVKKKVLIKLKLINHIIGAVFNLMVTEPEDGYSLGDDSDNPMTSAIRAMNLLALNIPSEKLIPPLLELITPALEAQDPLRRRAAYMSMAMIAEGCSDAICSQYLDALINAVKVGVADATPLVSDAAFYALGQFSEHLQPDISKFASQIMPIFFDSLQRLCTVLNSDRTEPKNIKNIFYAIESFCENLEDKLVPYLSTLMEFLCEAIRQNTSVRVRELALGIICAAANATEENMIPYMPVLKTIWQSFLVETDDENIKILLPQSIDSLAALARAVGKENFQCFTADSIRFALNLIETTDESDVRRALYNLLGSLATVLNDEMGFIYPKIMQRIFDSIHSTEEAAMVLMVDDNEQNEQSEDDEEDDEDDAEEDDEMGDTADNGVENLNLQEKEQAILALKDFAEHTGSAFIPHLEQSYKNVFNMTDHSEEDIRKVSVDTLCAFVIALYKHEGRRRVTDAITSLLPALNRIVREDEAITVVLAALEGINEILKELKQDALSTEHLRNCVFVCIEDIIHGRASCQHIDSEGNEDEIGEESEYEETIVQLAANILPLFGQSMKPEDFMRYFQRICPIMIRKLREAITLNALDTLRFSFYGSFADSFEALEHKCGALFNTLCPVMLGGFSDECGTAREYAIYGLGTLVRHSKGRSFHAYPDILSALHQAILKEKNLTVLDNICCAISCLITTNCALVPLAEVLPIYVKLLPLREDFDQYAHVLKCLDTLYKNAPDSIITTLEIVVATILDALGKVEEQESHDLAINLLCRIISDHPQIAAVIANSNPELVGILETL